MTKMAQVETENRKHEEITEAVTQKCSMKKKSSLKNFVKFRGKHLCWILFLIKLQA